MTSAMITFEYQGNGVAFDPDARMWNLNAMHQASGSEPSKAPRFWVRQQQTQELLAALFADETVSQAHSFIETREGRNGGTWAHWQIAAAYAHYLDARFYLQWNRWAMERAQQVATGTDAAPLARVAALEGRGRHQ
ncbi:MAG: KilA-N domain-containing protein [Chloroflexales bacterium]